MATNYQRKILDLQYQIAEEAEKAQEMIGELKQLVKENENLDLINSRKLREAREIQHQSKNTPFAKKCQRLTTKTCHRNKQRIRMIKKYPHRYSLTEYLKAYGFTEKDLSNLKKHSCTSTNRAKQKRCVDRAGKRKEKALALKKKWQDARRKFL